jgi:hypothetical protein
MTDQAHNEHRICMSCATVVDPPGFDEHRAAHGEALLSLHELWRVVAVYSSLLSDVGVSNKSTDAVFDAAVLAARRGRVT